MKTLILSLIAMCSLLAMTAEDAAWVLNAQTDFGKAVKKAERENKRMIVLVVVKDGCSWCEKMVDETLQDKKIKEALADAVVVIADFHSAIAKAYEAKLTPTVYFIDKKTKKSIAEQIGYEKPGNFLITVMSAFNTLE